MNSSEEPWFIETWKSQIITGVSLLQAIFGIITAISILSPMCIPAGICQVVAAVAVLAIEAPSFVSFIRFAQPIGMIFEEKPAWIKLAFYVALAVIPCLFGCLGFFFILAFLCSLATAAIYGVLLVGRKGIRTNRFQSDPTGPYSPTSP